MDREDLLTNASERGARYLRGIRQRSVAPNETAVAALQRFAEPLPSGPTDAAEVLKQLDVVGSPATMANAGGRFFSGYGEDTGRMWSAFGELIKGRPAAENDEMLEAAAATFDLLGEWLGSATHAGSAAHAGGAAHDE